MKVLFIGGTGNISTSVRFVPGFQATIPFHQGILRTLAWFDEDERRKRIDDAVNREMDDLLAAYGA